MKWRENIAMKALAFIAAGGGIKPTPKQTSLNKVVIKSALFKQLHT